MFGCRTAFGVGSCALALCLGLGCGGATSHNPDGEDPLPSAGQGGKPVGQAGAPSGGSRSGSGGGGAAGGRAGGGSGGSSSDPPPIDGGCDPEDVPPPSMECDPFGVSTCGPGAGCYPFVDHPEGSGCDAQTYGTRCLTAGAGTQGALCGGETDDWCAPGFVCVVGQRAGKRCAALCKPGVSGQCSGGLLCGDLDVADYGVCG